MCFELFKSWYWIDKSISYTNDLSWYLESEGKVSMLADV